MRWISTANPGELTGRLGNITGPTSPSESVSLKAESPTSPSETSNIPVTLTGHGEDTTIEDIHFRIGSQRPTFDLPIESDSPSTKLPLIPSFSEFINNKKVNDNRSRSSQVQSEGRGEKKSEKRMKFQ